MGSGKGGDNIPSDQDLTAIGGPWKPLAENLKNRLHDAISINAISSPYQYGPSVVAPFNGAQNAALNGMIGLAGQGMGGYAPAMTGGGPPAPAGVDPALARQMASRPAGIAQPGSPVGGGQYAITRPGSPVGGGLSMPGSPAGADPSRISMMGGGMGQPVAMPGAPAASDPSRITMMGGPSAGASSGDPSRLAMMGGGAGPSMPGQPAASDPSRLAMTGGGFWPSPGDPTGLTGAANTTAGFAAGQGIGAAPGSQFLASLAQGGAQSPATGATASSWTGPSRARAGWA